MQWESRKFFRTLIRYVILLFIGIPHLWLFYIIFSPLTIYPVSFLLKLLFDVTVAGNVIIVNNLFPIEIIKACVAGAAYYLLLILNLAIPMKLAKRLKLLTFSFLALLLINILRIFLLSLLFIEGFSFFDVTHELFWYFGSTLFVIAIWFVGVKIFKIRGIPFYSDLKSMELLKKIKKSKRPKKNK